MNAVCSECKRELPLDSFYVRKRANGTEYVKRCKDCTRESQRRYNKTGKGIQSRKKMQEKRKGRAWNYHVGRNYGITSDQFDAMMEEQQSRCAICGGTETYEHHRLCVDHDHITNKVRALLCSRCNKALGGFFDNPELLLKAVDYLNLHNSTDVSATSTTEK